MCTNLTIGLKNEINQGTFFSGSLTESHILLKSSVFNGRPYFFSTVSNISMLFSTSSVLNRISYCFVQLHFFHSLFNRRPYCFSIVSRSLFFINIRVVCFQQNTSLLFYGVLNTIFPFSDCLEHIFSTIFRLIMMKLFEVIWHASKDAIVS